MQCRQKVQSADKINKFNLWGGMQAKTLTQNASSRRKLKTLVLNASSNGGDASRVGKKMQQLFSRVCMPFLSLHAGRVAPIRASV